MIADDVLAAVFERPGITAAEIRAAFPTINPNTLSSCITLLYDEGFIERAGGGAYRPVPTEVAKVQPMRPKRPSTIAPASMARLMAGR
jgi:hypothetical protein